jgi:hypothetical protein
MAMLPIGAVVPTKNCAAFLPEHLATMQPWLDLVEELVVVDSFSTDGTMEFLRANVQHPRLTLLQHPPGLYESWNYGVSRIKSKYVYIATVGDAVTRDGLQRLFATAEALGCDVVVSKPYFRDPQGQHLAPPFWPIDDMIRSLRITQPRRLERLEALVFAITSATAAMTGSCASDLFRTQSLQRFPFPTNFGTAGDGAWAIRHALDVIWAVEPAQFSSFLVHPSNASEAERKGYQMAPRIDEVARQMIAASQAARVLSTTDSTHLRLDVLLDAVSAYLDAKVEFDHQRRRWPPWIVRPAAWRARVRRDRALGRLEALKQEALRGIARS